MCKKVRIGALISGTGSNLQAITAACEQGAVNGEIAFVGSDTPNASGLGKARRKGVPTLVADYGAILRSYRDRPQQTAIPDDFNLKDVRLKQDLFGDEMDGPQLDGFLTGRAVAEAALLEKMRSYPCDLIVLAGFMRVLTPYFIDRIHQRLGRWRIMNIHPALLPAFPGTDGYGDTFRYGCKVAGCTVHFVDYGEDSGPIIGQRAFAIKEGDTLNQVRQKGLALEWELYPQCIQLFAEGRLKPVRTSISWPDGRKTVRTVVRVLPPQSEARKK
jgi:phosphoribosylglycinamide formyltransferase-1